MTLAEAKKNIMDHVARRDHSEKELREKLLLRYDSEIVDLALGWAQEKNWLAAPKELAENLAERLHRRGQGIQKINQKLEERGLAPVESDPDDEFTKACKLALGRWSNEDFKGIAFQDAQKLKAKIARFLASRGFGEEIVEQILKNELKAGALSHDEEY